MCSHVAGLLFKLVAATQLELNKVLRTETLCSWKKSRKKVHPRPLKYMNFKRLKHGDHSPSGVDDKPFEGNLVGYSTPDPIKFCTDKQKLMFEKLRKIAPDAAVLKSLVSLWISDDEESLQSETDSANETNDKTGSHAR